MQDLTTYAQSMRHEDEEAQVEAMAKYLNLPYISLIGYPIVPDVLAIIPRDLAIHYSMIAFMRTGNKVQIAITNPQDPEAVSAIEKLATSTGYEFSLSICSHTSIEYALSLYPEFSESPAPKAEAVKTKNYQSLNIRNLGELKDLIRNSTTTSVLDLLFAGAVQTDAADIHIEPIEQGARVRYRIDGVLQEIAVLPMTTFKPIDSRIKFLAHLKMDVRNIPQDGRFTINSEGQKIDVRVSTMPATYGEIIDLRLLNSRTEMVDLTNLGFRPDALKMIEEAIAKPNGLILNTGPTGSGKTTTLYSILMRLNKPGIKIITLEDPVEYRIPGIDQVQIDNEHKYTFPVALRASVRQDPNIIMVGEIRDRETAEIAFQASMTGHLVLSTLHTNNAPAAIPRLIDMGVEPYLLAGSINLIIAQRLVRKLCSTCHGKGCDECNSTGYKGRVAIIECLKPSDAIEKLIMTKAPLSEFLRVAKSEGMKTMEEDGLEKVAQGVTTEEEIQRVTLE